MLKKSMLVSVIALCVIMASSAQAVYFQDDFEDDAAVTTPSALDADPVAAVGSWYILEQQTTADSFVDVQVINDATPGPAQGDNYLKVHRVGYARAYANFASVATGTVTMDFDMYVTTNSDPWAGPRVWIRNDTDTALGDGTELTSDLWQANAQLWHYNSVGSRTVLGAYPMDQWFHVTYEFDIDNATYDLTVDGTTYSNLDYVTSQNQIQQLAWQGTARTALFYIDDVIVVPEPISMVLLAFGGGVLLRRRHA